MCWVNHRPKISLTRGFSFCNNSEAQPAPSTEPAQAGMMNSFLPLLSSQHVGLWVAAGQVPTSIL